LANISKYFPSFMGEIREFKALANAENPEFELLPEAIETILSASFIENTNTYGIGRLEKITGITSKGTDTLDERKFRILAKFNEYIPYTWNALTNMLDSLLGLDGYEKERIPREFNVLVRVGLSNAKKFDAVKELLDRIIPVNMTIDLTILYNRHYEVGVYRHEFLSGYTHEEIRMREIPVFITHEKLNAATHRQHKGECLGVEIYKQI